MSCDTCGNDHNGICPVFITAAAQIICHRFSLHREEFNALVPGYVSLMSAEKIERAYPDPANTDEDARMREKEFALRAQWKMNAAAILLHKLAKRLQEEFKFS